MGVPELGSRDLIAPALRPGRALLAEGAALAKDWRVGRNLFLDTAKVASEAAYKRAMIASGRIMQHAHIGFRSVERTVAGIMQVHEACARHGATVDRFGITLDWSMGYPRAERAARGRGTGIVLSGPEDFGRITNAAPAAAHFGDFMLGLPSALENTQAALAAGATAIGNLGQYFTFRLPHWDDDVATTEATVIALGLISAQEAEVLVHSNLDDGFAGLFADMSSALGMVLVEKYVVEELIGARLAHCYGHHFTSPLSRLAFHQALTQVSDSLGTMIFGNTVSYQSTPAANYASLASYLQADIWSLRRSPTGHAINPVPTTENERIPDVDEIIDAQLFAARLVEHASASAGLIDEEKVDWVAATLVEGGRAFAANVLSGLAERGIDTKDPAQTLLALRRIGPKRLEQLFAAGPREGDGRPPRPLVRAEWVEELDTLADRWIANLEPGYVFHIGRRALKACIGTSDVHEHGKHLVERVCERLGVAIIDGGTSTDPDDLVLTALAGDADFIAVSTYNGIALRYISEVLDSLKRAGADLPVCIGGRLNQVPEDSNSGLPVDVGDEIRALGVTVCRTLDDFAPLLERLARSACPRESGNRFSDRDMRKL